MKKAPRSLDLSRSEQVEHGCQLCHKEPWIAKVPVDLGAYRLGQRCLDRLKTIAKENGREVVLV